MYILILESTRFKYENPKCKHGLQKYVDDDYYGAHR